MENANALLATVQVPGTPPIDAVRVAEHALTLARQQNDTQGEAAALLLRGQMRGRLGQIADAVADLEAHLSLARDGGRNEAHALHHLGTAVYLGDEAARGFALWSESIALQRAYGENDLILATLSNIGAYYGMLGDYAEATAYFIEALDRARESGNTTRYVYAAGNLALIKTKCGDFDAALALYAETAEREKAIGDLFAAANTLSNMANLLLRMDRLDAAEETAREAISLARQIQSPQREALALTCLGNILARQERFQEALPLLQEAARKIEVSGYSTLLATLFRIMSLCFAQESSQALAWAHRSLEEGEKRGDKNEIAESQERLVQLYEEQGDARAALRYFRAFHDTQEQQRIEAAQKLLMAQQAKVELHKAQELAEVHRRENEELARLVAQKSRQLREAESRAVRFARQATTDALTGLYNRRYLAEYLPHALQNANVAPVCAAIADLDNFKQINDRWGHDTGDLVLKATAGIMESSCRPSDVVVRYGGEEFALVFPGADLAEGKIICERICAAIASFNWESIHPLVRVTVSIGVAQASSDAPQELLTRADTAVYEAKRVGKNRVCVAELSKANK